MLIPLLHRHYFQSVLSAMVYARGGAIHNATTLSDDGSTLNFVTEEFAERANLQQVGVWRGTIKQLKDTVELDAPMYQIFFQLAPPPPASYFRLSNWYHSHWPQGPSGALGHEHIV